MLSYWCLENNLPQQLPLILSWHMGSWCDMATVLWLTSVFCRDSSSQLPLPMWGTLHPIGLIPSCPPLICTSARRCRSIQALTTRLKSSFYPKAITTLNSGLKVNLLVHTTSVQHWYWHAMLTFCAKIDTYLCNTSYWLIYLFCYRNS